MSGESGALSVLDNVTAKCLVLLLSGKHAQFCPSCRTHWQTGRRGTVWNGAEQSWVEREQGRKRVHAPGLVCGLTVPSISQSLSLN